MNRKLFSKLTMLCAVLSCGFFALFSVTPVSAVTEASTILKKVLINSLETCYQNQYMTKEIYLSDYNTQGINALVMNTNKVIQMPSTIENGVISDKKISCRNVFDASDNWKINGTKLGGLYQLYRKPNNIEDLGYEPIGVPLPGGGLTHLVGSGGHANAIGCISIEYQVKAGTKYDTTAKYNTGQYCFNVQDGKVQASDANDFTHNAGSGPVRLSYDGTNLSLTSSMAGVDFSGAACLINYQSWSDAASKCGEQFKNLISGARIEDTSGRYIEAFAVNSVLTELASDTNYQKKNNNATNAQVVAVRYFTDNPQSPRTIGFTKQERYDWMEMYYNALKGHGISEAATGLSKAEATADGALAHHNSDGTWSRLSIDSSLLSEKVYLVKGTGIKLQAVTIEEMIKEMMNWDFDDPDFDAGNTGVENNVTEDGGDSGKPNCLDTSGTSLGWILCPTLELIGNAAAGVYDNIETDWLTISANDMLANRNNGIYDGWSQFRDFANIAFVIALAIVILSQVTGIGVSNYGIKKILPSLIVVAILVNLSFFVCQIAVDLSNIVGSSIHDMFKDFSTGVVGEGDASLSGILGFLFGTVGITVAGYSGLGAAISSPQIWLIPLLCAVLTAVIAVLMFFILLAVRKAGIFVLVILSPLAIICYALPNTKNLFDKWKKAFVSLLILYPICGIVTGGGEFFSALFLKMNKSDFLFNLVAMMLQIVPLFFIPSLLRNSLTALGNIGTKLSNFGGRLSRDATGALRRSDSARRLSMGAGVLGDKYGSKAAAGMRGFARRIPGIGGALKGFDRTKAGKALEKNRQLRQATFRQQYKKMMGEDFAASLPNELAEEGSTEYSNLTAGIQRKYDEEQVDNAMNSYINRSDFNHNDLDTVGTALAQAMVNQDNNPEDQQLRYNTRALAKLLTSTGPNGYDKMMETIKNHSETSDGHQTRTRSGSDLLSYISLDGKQRANIKANNYGDDKYITDYLGTGALNDRSTYESMVAKSPDAILGAGDAYFLNMIKQIKAGAFRNDAAGLEKVEKMATSALTDPRIASRVKDDVAGYLNNIRLAAHNARMNQYVRDELSKNPQADVNALQNDFIQKNGRFKKIDPRSNVLNVR